MDEIKSDTIALGCPNNQLIKLGRVIYGYSWSNDCSYIDKDCTMNVPREDIFCLSRNNCTVRVVEHPLILQDCWNLAATYIQAEYECIKDFTIGDICQKQDTRLSHGFLSTPMYPNGFSSHLNCPCTLTPSINHSIIFELIDISLPNCSEANLLLSIGHDFQNKCQKQNPVTLIGHIQQNITMRFFSLKHVKHGGVLMKYSVSPQSKNGSIRVQCFGSFTNNRSVVISQFIKSKSRNENDNVEDDEEEEDIPTVNMKQFRDSPENSALNRLNSNSPIKKKNLLPESPRSNLTLMVVFVITVIIFLLIINILVCFLCSFRTKSSQSTASNQNLYSHHDLFNPIYPKTSNRLKTLQSLIYAHPKRPDMEPITTNSLRPLDSALSDGQLRTHSSSTNLNHGFIFKSKSNLKTPEPRQISSWDDI